MPKWKLNPRTGMMEPERKTGVEITKRMGGLMVEDHDRGFRFMIMYRTDDIQYVSGFEIRRTGLHLFNHNDAVKIADTVKRVCGVSGSKYTDWRYFMVGMKDSDIEDKMTESVVNSIVESLGNNDYEPINEYWLSTKSADEETIDMSGDKVPRKFARFMVASGIKLLKCLLIPGYWAYLTILTVGSLHMRFQKRFTKSLLNDAAYQKILRGDGLSNDEIKQKIAKDILSENKLYWVALSNGEVVRVVAMNEEEAKDMAKSIIENDFEKNYSRYSSMRQTSSGMNTYRVYMKGGEVAYVVSDDKYKAMKDAQTTREILYKGFKNDKRYSLKFSRNNNEKLRVNNERVMDMERPEAYKVDNLGNSEIKLPLKDDEHLTVYTHEPSLIYELSGNRYTIEDIPGMTLNVICNNDRELENIIKKFTENADVKKIMMNNEKNRELFVRNVPSVYAWDVKMENEDEYFLFINTNDIADEETKKRNRATTTPSTPTISDEKNSRDEAQLIARILEAALGNAHKSTGNGLGRNIRCRNIATRTVDSIERITDDREFRQPFVLPDYADATVTNQETGEEVGSNVRIRMYA